MIAASYIWLIASHLAVLFPLIIAFKYNKRRWLACSIVLLFTAFFSSIYHWHEIPNYDNYSLIGTGYTVHRSLDYFCSYLSIFLIVFYSLNPRQKLEHIDISLMIIVTICHFFTVMHPMWYFFCGIVILFCLIYSLFCKKTVWIDTLKNIYNYPIKLLFGVSLFVLGMLMQYYFCVQYPDGDMYRLYHGFWHFFMFSSAGAIMYWNEMIRKNNNNDLPQVDNNLEIIV